MYKLYLITNLINYKRYAGITSQTVRGRFIQHCSQGNLLTNAIKKHGRENFKVDLIASTDDLELIKKYEIKYIESLNLVDRKIGYNLSLGGDLVNKTQECRDKISKAMKGKAKSEEHRKKIRANAIINGEKRRGIKRPPFSEEWKNNLSKGHTGKILTESHRANISKALRNSEKFKNADKGKFFRENNPSKNETSKAKIARAKYKPVYCVNNQICYLSLKSAAEDLDLRQNSMSTALTRGNRIHGYKFYYIYK